MTEVDSIARAKSPATVSSLAGDVARVGVMQDMVLLVHSSLSAIGWIAGGAQALVLALEDALGPRGTLVMPAHSTNLSRIRPRGRTLPSPNPGGKRSGPR